MGMYRDLALERIKDIATLEEARQRLERADERCDENEDELVELQEEKFRLECEQDALTELIAKLEALPYDEDDPELRRRMELLAIARDPNQMKFAL